MCVCPVPLGPHREVLCELLLGSRVVTGLGDPVVWNLHEVDLYYQFSGRLFFFFPLTEIQAKIVTFLNCPLVQNGKIFPSSSLGQRGWFFESSSFRWESQF